MKIGFLVLFVYFIIVILALNGSLFRNYEPPKIDSYDKSITRIHGIHYTINSNVELVANDATIYSDKICFYDFYVFCKNEHCLISGKKAIFNKKDNNIKFQETIKIIDWNK